MIRKEDIVPLLLDACPGFRSAWKEHVAHWNGQSAGIYNDLAEFVHYLIIAFENAEISTVKAAFAVLERLLVDGDAEIQKYAVLGFIETLQSAASHEPYAAGVFVPFLKPHSLREWNAIEHGWQELMNRNQEG
jgi:hypothetical protein